MIDLAAIGDLAFLDLHEVAHLDVVGKRCSGAQSCKRADFAVVARRRTFDVAIRMHERTRAQLAVTNQVIRFDTHTIAEGHVPFEHGVDIDENIFAASEVPADVNA